MIERDSIALKRRKSGFRMLALALLLWLGSMIAIHVTIARNEGYGLGLNDGGRVPPSVVARANVGPRASDVVRATSNNIGPVGGAETLWRLLVSVSVLGGILWFWFLVISRIGIF